MLGGEPPLAGWVIYLDANGDGQRQDGERGGGADEGREVTDL